MVDGCIKSPEDSCFCAWPKRSMKRGGGSVPHFRPAWGEILAGRWLRNSSTSRPVVDMNSLRKDFERFARQ